MVFLFESLISLIIREFCILDSNAKKTLVGFSCKIGSLLLIIAPLYLWFKISSLSCLILCNSSELF